jgi:hypothetical protein
MVPLVSLFSDTSMPEETEKWCTSIEIALAFLARSKPWSVTAKRTLNAVSGLYQAYKTHFTIQPEPLKEQTSDSIQQFANNMQGQNVLSYNAPIPDMDALAMNSDATDSWSGDPNAIVSIGGFWDGTMWDMNLPDILETPLRFGADLDFQNTAQDTGTLCWMQGY